MAASQMAQIPPAGTRKQLFISHALSDIDFTERLATALKRRGHEVWLDRKDLLIGAGFEPQVLHALASSDAALYIISQRSIRSEWTLREFSYAVKEAKPVLLVLYQKATISDIPRELQVFPSFIFDEQAFDESLEKLIEAIDSMPRIRSTSPLPVFDLDDPKSVPPANQSGVMVHVIQQSETVPRSIPATPDLANLMALAALIRMQASDIGTGSEEPFNVSFSWLLLAFLAADNPLSQWFKRYVDDAELTLKPLYEQAQVNEKVINIVATGPITAIELDTVKGITASTYSLLTIANKLLNTVSAGASQPLLDVRHVIGAYIYEPAGHEGDLIRLGIRRHDWSNSFLGWVKQHHPSELEAWKSIHRQKFPAHPPLVIDEGLSTHIATDRWTLEDTLGYRAYAYAIRRFMTHPQTRAPLTISIQAPWGGGKTSLMRMIQQELDPDAVRDVRDEAEQPRGALTIRDALEEIGEWIRESTQKPLPTVSTGESQVLTVWFNAWKYESVNQVWAGLVDAIMRQVAARLDLVEREQFWLRLNLKRIDAERLRQRIHDRVFQIWWRTMRKVVLAAVAAFGASLAVVAGWWQAGNWGRYLGAGAAAASAITPLVLGAWRFFRTKKEVESEPAAVSLGDYLDIPDYNAELGFIHRVEADLRRVLASVPRRRREDGTEQNLRIVVFIDDLDRCSPTKVAQVVEAVNLFLAGDFNDCMFVMGMDTEMVAAALQAAHKEMIAQLPSDAGIPVGWRFMDKFVQLPFLIPPTEDAGLEQYTTSLLSARKAAPPDPKADELLEKIAPRVTTFVEVEREVKRLRDENQLDERAAAALRRRLEPRVAEAVRSRVDEGIAKFNDENEEIRRVVSQATVYFRGNPRELKRFVNAFRFNYFLWWAHRAQGFRGPSLDQLLRWSVLSMRWPEVVRWLRRSGGNEWRAERPGNNGDSAAAAKAASLPTRLKLLEEISGAAVDLASWQRGAAEKLRLKADETPWLADDDLLQFFHEEFNQVQAGERLSDGAGKGLW